MADTDVVKDPIPQVIGPESEATSESEAAQKETEVSPQNGAAAKLQKESSSDIGDLPPAAAEEDGTGNGHKLAAPTASSATVFRLGGFGDHGDGSVPASPISLRSRQSQRSVKEAEEELEREDEDDKVGPLTDEEPLVSTKTNDEKVSLVRLFQYADKFDHLAIATGCFFAAAHGVFLPMIMLLFGDTITLLSGNSPGARAASNLSNASNMTTSNVSMALPPNINGLTEKMGDLAIIYCGLAAGALIVTYIQVAAWATVGERLTRRIRKLFFAAILNQDMSWFDTHKTGELASRMSDDLVKVYDGLGDKNGLFFQWIATHVTALIIAFVKGWKVTLIVFFGAGPFLAASGVFVSKLVADVGSKEQDAYAKAGAVAGEVLSAVRTVVAFGGEKQEAERYEKELEEARLFSVRKGLYQGLGFSVVYAMIFMTYALAFYTGTKFVWDGDLAPGDMVTAFFTVVIACFALGHAAPSIQASAEARGAAVAVYNIIDNVPSINTSSPSGEKPDKIVGDFEFQDVHFTYPSRPDVKILNGLNMKIQAGKTTALVGPSGCGKSTCLQLLQRFYDVDDGSTLVDGVDLRDLNVKWLRSQIGVVSQEPVLFHTTIRENISYGSLTEVTEDDIINAAKKANAHNFIMGFPDGYDTQVGERGAQMSGGQKQRIAIARSLIRNPRILLLDEATSALDTESERIVQQALEAASEGRTTVIIAHRLTTVRNADCIIALKDGLVEEQGNHDNLMAKKGLYHALVTMQMAVTEEDGDTKDSGIEASKETISKKESDASKKHKDEKADKAGKAEEEEEEEDLPEIDTKRLLSYNRPEFPTMALGAFCALCFGVVFPAYGLIFAEVLSVFTLLGDPANKDEYFRRTYFWAGMFLVLAVSCFTVLLAQSYFFGRSGAALTKRMRSITFRALLRQDIGFFDHKAHSTGALTTRLASDAALIQGGTGQKIGNIFQLISTLGSALIISFLQSWEMTLLILALIPMVGAAGAAHTKALAGHGSTNKDEHLEAGKTAVEVIDNVRTVVSLGLEDRCVDRYMTILEPAYKKHKRARHFQGFTTGLSESAFFLVYAITFAFGAFLIEEGRANFTNVFTVFGSMVFGAFSLGQSAAFAPDIGKAAGAASRIFKLVDRVPEIDVESEEGDKPGDVKGQIELKDISFHYPTRQDVQVFQGATITAAPGQTVALVGQSGCGKSTSVSLLERFYDPLAGVVSLDGKDIKSLNIPWLRRQIGLVQQEPILFDASIADNIAYGALDTMVTIEQIQEAAKKSNIHNFITSLPDGYDTNVGAKGTQLSGGQKQRIAIARALIRSPKILLLDEATSALDTESEKIVQEALDAARQGRTSIVIAHRLSTIHNSDKIIVLGGGKVLEQGTHSELMALGGAYFKLNVAQEGNTGASLA